MLNFEGLKAHLAPNYQAIVAELLPGGRLKGERWVCGSIEGGEGDSFDFHLGKGLGGDWAEPDSPKLDIIDLYCASRGVDPGTAYHDLALAWGYSNGHHTEPVPPPAPPRSPIPDSVTTPNGAYVYHMADGRRAFWVERTATKQFIPWSWDGQSLVCKSWPAPRPLYNLHRLTADPAAQVVVVEGEKTADAVSRGMPAPGIVAVTWPNGASSWGKADLTPLHGRDIIMCPDADEPGRKAMAGLVGALAGKATRVRVADPPEDSPKGWDLADYEGCSMRTWIREHLVPDAAAWADKIHGPEPVLPVDRTKRVTSTGNSITVVQGGKAAPATARKVKPESRDGLYELYGEYGKLWESLGIRVSCKGKPVEKVKTVYQVLKGVPEVGEHIWYDEFIGSVMTDWGASSSRRFADNDYNRLALHLEDIGLVNTSASDVQRGLTAWSMANPRNEPLAWLEAIRWDGKARVDDALVRYFGAADGLYVRQVSRNFWLSLAARIALPRSKVDNMVILEGNQGTFKTTACQIIGGKWFASITRSVSDPDFVQEIQGKLLVELGEMSSFSKADAATFKGMMTREVDTYRASYGRHSEDRPRRTVFIGTTNLDRYLTDETGNRRFWPVKIGNIDLGSLAADRDQLFAEALSRVRSGEPWHVVDRQVAAAEADARRESDPWEDLVIPWLATKQEVTTDDVAAHLKIEPGRIDVGVGRRIGKCLRVAGWVTVTARRNGKFIRVWRTNSLPEIFERQPGDEDF